MVPYFYAQARRKLFVIGGGLKPRAEGPSRAPLARVLLGGGGVRKHAPPGNF